MSYFTYTSHIYFMQSSWTVFTLYPGFRAYFVANFLLMFYEIFYLSFFLLGFMQSFFFQKTCNSFHNQCNFIIIQRMLILDHLYRIFVFPFSFFRSLSLYFKESILSFLTQTEPGEEKTEQSFFLIQVLFNFLFRPHSTL